MSGLDGLLATLWEPDADSPLARAQRAALPECYPTRWERFTADLMRVFRPVAQAIEQIAEASALAADEIIKATDALVAAFNAPVPHREDPS